MTLNDQIEQSITEACLAQLRRSGVSNTYAAEILASKEYVLKRYVRKAQNAVQYIIDASALDISKDAPMTSDEMIEKARWDVG